MTQHFTISTFWQQSHKYLCPILLDDQIFTNCYQYSDITKKDVCKRKMPFTP